MTRASGAARRGRRAAPLHLATVADDVDVFLREQVDPAGCVLAAVMFTDIARSRVHLPRIDERAWPEVVEAYGDIVGRQAMRYNGRIVQSDDGSFVRFSGAYSAVRCALAIRQDLRDLGVDLRAGLHAGQEQLRDADVFGVVAHVANRICCVAGSGRVLTSRVLADLVTGPSVLFEDAGTYELGDVPGEWELLAVSE